MSSNNLIYFQENERRSFSNAIRAKRRELNLSQTQLAKKIGTTYQTINTWENNPPRKLSKNKLEIISRIFCVSTDWLLAGKGEMRRDNENKSKPSDKRGENMRFEDYIHKYGTEEEIFELDSIILDCQNKARAMANTIKERLNAKKKASA